MPFARHPASLCHVPFGSSLLRRWGWKLAWRRKVFLSNLPALRYGSCALPWGRSRQEAARLGRLRRGHRSLRSHPGPGVPAPGVLSLPLLMLQVTSGSQKVHVPVGKKIFTGPFLTSEGLGPSASPAAPPGKLPALTTPCSARASHRCPSHPQKCLDRARFSFPACTGSNVPSAARPPRGCAESRVNRDAQAGLLQEVRLSCPVRVLSSRFGNRLSFCLLLLLAPTASPLSRQPQDLLIHFLVSPHLRHTGVTEQQAVRSVSCLSVKAEL